MKTIEQQLRDTWSRERRLCHVRGFFRCLIWLLMLLLVGFVIDYGLLFKAKMPASVTLLLTVAGVATMAWVIWRDWISKLQPFDATRIAVEVEAENPELMSSLVSYTELEFMSSETTASPELLEAMRDFAVQKSSQLRFSDVIDFGEIKKLLGYAVVALLVSAGLSVRWSDHFSIMFKRMAGIQTSYPIQTKMLEITGDVVIGFGQSVDIKVAAGGVIPEVAVLYVRPEGQASGEWSEMPMEMLDNGFSFRRTVETPDREMTYYVTMGDYESPKFTISVVRSPRVVRTELQLELPAYLKRKNEVSDQLNVEVPEGTIIKWDLGCDKQVGQMTVNYGDHSVDAEVAENGTDVAFTLTADKSFGYTFAWTEGASGKGFHFEDVEYNVKVIRDARPRIAFVGRAPSGPATLSKSVILKWRAKDDYGLDKLWLVYSVTTPGSPDAPVEKRLLVQDHKGLINDDDTYTWELAKSIEGLKVGQEISYRLEVNDLKVDETGERITRTPTSQLTLFSKDDYMTWFRRELKSRNDLVKQTFVAERAASTQLKLFLLDKESTTLPGQLKGLEASQGTEARKMAKVSGDLAWLFDELESNNLRKEGGGEKLKVYSEVLADVSTTRLPTVTQHLRNARLESEAAPHYMQSAKEEVDAIVNELKEVLASSSTLLIEEALIVELREMIKIQAAVRGETAEWSKAQLINPEAVVSGKGPLMQRQSGVQARYVKFLEQLQRAREDALDDAAVLRFKQAEDVLNPAPPEIDNAAVLAAFEAELTVGDFLDGAIEQIERSDGLSAIGAQDRVIAMFKSALQILSAGQFEIGEFVAGLELLIKKQRVLRKDTDTEEALARKAAFYEARQIEIQDEVTNYSFDAPDLFVNKKGEFLVEPLMLALEDAVTTLGSAKKPDALIAQDKVIVLLESVYGTALEKKDTGEEGEAQWTFSPEIPEDRYKLPPDGESEDAAMADPDMPDIFEAPTSANLMIQEENASEGAMPEVSTMVAANLFLGMEGEEKDDEGEDEPPPFITDEGPPVAPGDVDALRDAGGKGDGDTTDVDVDRLAGSAMQRKRQKAKIQDYVRQVPPEFRRQLSDYYEEIGK